MISYPVQWLLKNDCSRYNGNFSHDKRDNYGLTLAVA